MSLMHQTPSIRQGQRAISLIEVLIVIFVLTILLSVLVPSFGGAREQSRRLVCKGNLKQLGTAGILYRDDNNDYIPTEGSFLGQAGGDNEGVNDPRTWYNTLPKYLGLPAYKDVEDVNVAIKEFPDLHVWICPSKNLTRAYKSDSGKNQFHYGMNQVLDGMGGTGDFSPPSSDTPDFPDQGSDPRLQGRMFASHPTTVFLFDIAENMMAGSPRKVATRYAVDFEGKPLGEYHGDFANILYLDGGVADCVTADLVTDNDFVNGDIDWDSPKLYWGYRPSPPPTE